MTNNYFSNKALSIAHNKPHIAFMRGFTLIELLVVISIIGMLSSVVLVSLQGARDKGRIGAGLKFATYNYHAFGDNLFVRFDFNEANGVPTDYSSNNLTSAFNIALGGAAPTRVSSYGSSSGSALSFPGTSGVSIGQNSQVSLPAAITVALWIKTTRSDQAPIFGNRDASGPLFFGLSGGRLYHYEAGVMNTNISLSNAVVNDNNWHHITWSTNGTSGSYYIDGKFDKTYAFNLGPRQSFTSVSSISSYIGMDLATAVPYFTGTIDDFMIFKKELASSDIERLYADGLPTHTLAEAR